MKITKPILAQIIKEEMAAMNLLETNGDSRGMTAQEVASTALKTAHAQRGGGISDEERGVIRELVTALTAAAGKTDLLSGIPEQKMKQIMVVLNKIIGEQPPPVTEHRRIKRRRK